MPKSPVSAVIPDSVVNRIKSLPYDKAQAAVKQISESPDTSDEMRSAYELLLVSHPGKNGNGHVKPAAESTEASGKPAPRFGSTDGSGPVGRVWEEKIGGPGLTMDQVLKKVASKEIEPEDAAKLLAARGEFTVFCSENSGSICLGFGGRQPTSMWEDNLVKLLANAEAVSEVLAAHHDETVAANEAAKARKAAR